MVRTPPLVAAVAVALTLALASPGSAQGISDARAPREQVRTEIVARVGAVRRLTVRAAETVPAVRGGMAQRAVLEIASNAGCQLVARGTGGEAVRLSLDGGAASTLRPGDSAVLRELPPGVHRVVVSLESSAVPGTPFPVTLELADPGSSPAAMNAPATLALGSD